MMTANNVLIVRLEMASQTLRLAAVEAKDRSMTDLAVKITELGVEVDKLVLLANPTLRCECDPDTCDGCADCSCQN